MKKIHKNYESLSVFCQLSSYDIRFIYVKNTIQKLCGFEFIK